MSPPMQFQLKSFTGDFWYNISLGARTCDCQDFLKTPGPCKHLNALGIYRDPKAFVPKTHPSFSQAISAMIKSIRLRRPEDAIYWLVYLDGLRNEKRARYRTARRLLIGSAEDGHSVAVMENVVSNFSILNKEKTDLLYLASEVVRICKIPNWWNPATGGHDYIYNGMVGERELNYLKISQEPESLANLLKESIEQRKKSTALAAVMGFGHTNLGSTKQAELMLALAQKYDHPIAARLARVNLSAKSALAGDNNFLCQAAWMMASGVSPVADVIEPVFVGEVAELLDKAKERWKDPQPIPGWACDGIHCAGQDVRFAGCWNLMYGVCKAFEKYGRVDPRDDWLPSFMSSDGLITREPPVQGSAIDCTRITP